MTIKCRNEDGYGNVTYVEYEILEPIEVEEEDITPEEILNELEDIL